jgi:peptidoglycan/xylan/chitin deacetylase (PgdA/CDA1 family)
VLKRYIKQEVLSRAFARVPRRYLDKLSPTGLIIPYYHIISDDKVVHVWNLYPYKGTREFTEDLEYLLGHYAPIGLQDVLETVESNGGFSRRSFHLTFDDGFRELYDVVAPILLRKGVPATFFINSAFTDNKTLCYQHKASILVGYVENGISAGALCSLKGLLSQRGILCADIPSAIKSVPYERREELDELARCMGVDFDDYLGTFRPYLDSSQIRSLIGKGFSIGSHSIDHPLYSDIGLEEQVRQTVESTRWVRKEYGLGYGAFAFPHNDRDVEERFYREIRASGDVDISFGTGGMINGKLSRHLQRFSLEKPLLPAGRIIAMQHARKLWRDFRFPAPPVVSSPA